MKQNLLLLTVVCLMPIWSHAQSLPTSNVDKVSDANITMSESRINHQSSSYLVNEGFENYEIGPFEPVYPWSFENDMSDANISDNHAYTGEKSLNIEGDMEQIFCDMGGLTSGHYVLNMYWYLEQNQRAYMEIDKDGWDVGSCEVFIFGADYAWINIPDGSGEKFQSVHWDNVEYDTWFPLTFDIDLDNDWITFSVNNEMVAEWQYSLSNWGGNGLIKLDRIEFDANMKKQGEGTKTQIGEGDFYYSFYIDDVTLMDVNGGDFNPVENLVSQVSADTVTLSWSEPQGQSSSYLVNEGFENYEVGTFEPVYPWSADDDIRDANISDNHANTGEKSLNIVGWNDYIFCDMGGLTSGHYVLNVYLYLEQDQWAYMEIDKDGYSVCSCEIFIFAADYAWINIPDKYLGFQSVHWDYVEYDTWFPLTFDIDMDNDWITFSVSNEMVAGWQYSLSRWGENGIIKLDKIEFDGDMKKHGDGSKPQVGDFYIDDVTLMDVNGNKDVVIGYNVTRDGELVGITDDTSFTETGLTNGTYNYCVTAVYSEGESEPVCVDAIVDYLLVGDANGDGEVNVADVSAIAAYIVGHNPSPFYFENADVNGDGIINVGDVTALIYIFFSEKGSCEPVDNERTRTSKVVNNK